MSDLISSISVVFVFLGYLFTENISEIKRVINEKYPDKDKKTECDKLKKRLNTTTIKAMFFAIGYFVLFYLLLPTSVNILLISQIDLWNFDLLPTLFIVIEILTIIILFYILNLIWKLRKKRKI
mgnify:CR=1 FL=1